MKAKKGSVGVGFFVNTIVLIEYDVRVTDSFSKGIMWLHFRPLRNEKPFQFCVCYLPPKDSTRNIDHGEFYETLLYQSFSYCKDKMFYICGDFNGRLGDLEVYTAGMDCLPDRDVVV